MAAMAVTCDQVIFFFFFFFGGGKFPLAKKKKNRLIAGYDGSENVT